MLFWALLDRESVYHFMEVNEQNSSDILIVQLGCKKIQLALKRISAICSFQMVLNGLLSKVLAENLSSLVDCMIIHLD